MDNIDIIIDKSKIKYMETMDKHTTMRVGGPADIFVSPTNVDEIVGVLKYAKDNNMHYKLSPNYSVDQKITIKLKEFEFKYYPYMDTFKYLALDGELSNILNIVNTKKEFYFLNKILDYVINGFTKSNATTFDNTYSYEERPNYYENNKSIQTDILNVIVLEIEVEFKVINCLNTIIWE